MKNEQLIFDHSHVGISTVEFKPEIPGGKLSVGECFDFIAEKLGGELDEVSHDSAQNCLFLTIRRPNFGITFFRVTKVAKLTSGSWLFMFVEKFPMNDYNWLRNQM